MKKTLYMFVFFLGLLGQTQEIQLSERQLMAMPLDTLKNFINKNFDNNIELTHSYSKVFLKYSNQKKDKSKTASAYLFLIMSAPDNDSSLMYCDSLIESTKDFNNHKYPAFAHYMKAEILYYMYRNKEALDEALIANKKITSKTSVFFKSLIKNAIAIKGAKNNRHELAITYFHKSLSYFMEEKNDQYLTTLFGLAESHLALGQLDSTSYYINRGYKEATGQFVRHHVLFLMTEGRLAYRRENFIKAEDNLNKSLAILESNQDLSNLAINAYWLGKSENILGDSLSALYHFKMVDSIFNVNKSIPMNLRPAWTELIDFYKKKGDLKNELKYAHKLIVVDSILDLEYGYMTDKITNEFVLPTIEQKHRQKQQELEKSKKTRTTWLGILTFLLCAFAGLFFLYRKRELKRIKDYNLVMKRLKKNSSTDKQKSKTLKLKKELLNSIEQSLKLFEKNEGYLKNSITLSEIAKEMGTNQRYLSQYINHFKGMGFPEYINTLRIEYVLKRLSNSFINREDRFRIWSMSEVGKAAGFGGREYYAKAFFKYTNMKHSAYVNQLEKSYNKSRNS